jgi:hypothetical protein
MGKGRISLFNCFGSKKKQNKNYNASYVRQPSQILAAASDTIGMPTYRCLKFTYDVVTAKWTPEHTAVRIASSTFSEGGMRVCFRADELVGSEDAVSSVVKIFKPQILVRAFLCLL